MALVPTTDGVTPMQSDRSIVQHTQIVLPDCSCLISLIYICDGSCPCNPGLLDPVVIRTDCRNLTDCAIFEPAAGFTSESKKQIMQIAIFDNNGAVLALLLVYMALDNLSIKQNSLHVRRLPARRR